MCVRNGQKWIQKIILSPYLIRYFIFLLIHLTGCLPDPSETSAASPKIRSVVSVSISRGGMWPPAGLPSPGLIHQIHRTTCRDFWVTVFPPSRCQWSVSTSRRWLLCLCSCWPSSWSLWSSSSCCATVQRKSTASVCRPRSRPPGECCMASMVSHWAPVCLLIELKYMKSDHTITTPTCNQTSSFHMYIVYIIFFSKWYSYIIMNWKWFYFLHIFVYLANFVNG